MRNYVIGTGSHPRKAQRTKWTRNVTTEEITRGDDIKGCMTTEEFSSDNEGKHNVTRDNDVEGSVTNQDNMRDGEVKDIVAKQKITGAQRDEPSRLVYR